MYDLEVGYLIQLRTNENYNQYVCLANDFPNPEYMDSMSNTAAGEGYYYLVRSENI